ncbi:ubiquitin-like modifier-activating enzyme 6, partial [Salmo salar]|uniref:Ubiquitin-like modifier-activating enzyme 6 n=1 Tax=Salmo salar TaxID=8030 RepID=A0ABM3E907_SALSA
CVILTEARLSLQKKINDFCHFHQPPIRGETSRPSYQVRPLDPPIRVRNLDPPIRVRHLDPPIRVRTLDPPIRVRTLDPPIRVRNLDPPIRVRPLDPPIRVRPLDPPIRVRPLDPPIRVRPLDPPIRVGPLDPPIRVGPLDPPIRVRPLDPPIRGETSRPSYQGQTSRPSYQGETSRPSIRVRPLDPPIRVRPLDPPIRFIGCDAYGICVRVFCDFGDQFEVSDPTGEEAKEMFIQNITQGNPGVVTCMDSRTHGLQTGQSVLFREVNGMDSLNGTARQVTVLSPYSFTIGDTSCLQPYAHGGFFLLVKTPRTYSFETMEQQLSEPRVLTPDFSKPEAPLQIHAAMLALDAFQEQHNRLPNIGCCQDAEVLVKLTEEVNLTLTTRAPVNSELVCCLSRTAQGSLPPLSAAVGGIASQEVLKALTGKFAPLQQWFYLDAIEVVKPLQSLSAEEFIPRGDRYDGLRVCIGETMCLELHKLRVFMVGCGAIGCEMLKNFALLGVGLAKSSGEVGIGWLILIITCSLLWSPRVHDRLIG